MKVGIVGMPNAGKSSLFNALSKAGAEAANYPFTTIEPNVAVLPVPDDAARRRWRRPSARRTSSTTRSRSTTSPGLVRGAHEGEGLGNQFLGNIRETDAILHVVRAHGDDNVIHPEGGVDPARDIDTIETELIYADLEQAERRHARVVRDARSGDKAAVAEESWLAQVIDALQAGRPARTVPVPADAPNAMRDLSPLIGQAGPVRRQRRRGLRRGPAPRSPSTPPPTARRPSRSPRRIEAELSELDDDGGGDDARGDGRRRVRPAARRPRRLRAARPDRLLHRRRGQARRSPGTCAAASPPGTPPARSTPTSRRASSARRSSAGTALVEAGGYAGARDKGTLRLEGRDYLMTDGDVITVKHTG